MYAYKDILELAGLTTRIYTMLSTLHHLQPLPEFERHPERIELQGAVIGVPKKDPRLGDTALVGNAEEGFDFGDGGEATDATHSERPLVRDLNIRVERGEHLMISGPVGDVFPSSESVSVLTSRITEWGWQDGDCACYRWLVEGGAGQNHQARPWFFGCIRCSTEGVHDQW